MRNSKRGSSAVFLCVILASLIAVTLSLCYAARWKAAESCSDGVASLAGDSVMAEYDYYVERDYGLFLIDGTDQNLSSSFRKYVNYSLNKMKGVYLHKGSVSSARYSTINTEPVKEQILRSVKYRKFPSDERANTMEEHELRHGPTIVSLPSGQIPEDGLVGKVKSMAGNMKDPGVFFRKGTDSYMMNSYITGHFNSDSNMAAEDHFFRNEIEYIIGGKLSDEANVKKTDLIIAALHMPLNLAHIYADQEKNAAVLAAAETITPGVLGTVTQAGISAAWASAEALNDVKLLHKGYKVPLTKDASSWATDLDGVIEGMSDDVIKPDVIKGRDYQDHLRILLYTMDDEIKTARILDLIEINMRKNHNRDFLITECSSGISVDMEIRGRRIIERHSLTYDRTY